jgi:nucleotide-binding universal stress UspA family protein
MLYREILVPVDGSSASHRALDHAVELARDEHARLTIVVVVPPPRGAATAAAAAALPARRQAWEDILERARERVPGDVGLTTLFLDGAPGREISRLASSGTYDVVVMGTHGRGRLAGALIGSVSREVLHSAATPVLLVRADCEGAVPFVPATGA